ncbi:hypothetical protein SCA6_019932 [Theobroma cacao]
MLDQLTSGKETKGWWEAPIDQLNQQELEKLYLSFAELRTSLHSKMKEKSAEATSSQLAPMDPAQLTTPFPANPFPTNLNEQVPAQLNAPFPTNPFPTNLNEQVPAQLTTPFPTNPFPTNLNVQVPAQLTTPFPINPFPTNLNEQVPGFFPPGFGPGRQLVNFGTAEDIHDHVGSQQQAKVEKLSQQLNDLLKQIQAEKKRGEMLDKEIKASGKHKCQKPVNELSLDELLQMKQSMEELREKLKGRVSEIEASSSLLLLSNNGAKEADPDN